MIYSRLVVSITFVLVLGGAVLTPHVAFATVCTNNSECAADGTEHCDLSNAAASGNVGVCVYNGTGPAAVGGGAGSGNAGDPSKTFGWLLGGMMMLFASLTGYAGILLNDAVYYTVLTMGQYVNDLNAVGVVWHIMRDLGNIVLIFGFLAIGVCYILGVNWYGGGTKMLPMLLVAAILLNFSLFISEGIIDVGNVFGTQFYTQINGGKPIIVQDPTSLGSIQNDGISNIIMNSLGLQTLYNLSTSNNASGQPVISDTKLMMIGFLGIILFLVAAFVMFSLAFILIARFVILLFLIIIAPIGFAGLVVPKLKGYADQWWSQLIKQTITAPVLLLMLYVALAVINDAGFLTGFKANANSYTALATAQDGQTLVGFAGILLSFVVAMGLLLVCTYLAKSMSAFGASWATKTAGKMSFGLAFGGAAYGLSALTGGTAFGTRKLLQRVAPNSRLVRGISNYALRPIERARPDLRRLPGVGAGIAAIGAGEASKPIEKSAVGRVRQGVEWVQHGREESNKTYDREARVPRLKNAIAAGDTAAITQLMGNISDKELESPQMHRLLANPAAAAALPQNRFDKLMTSEALSDDVKNHLREERTHGLTARYTDAAEYRRPSTADIPADQRNQPVPSTLREGNMTRGEQSTSALGNQIASQVPEALLLNEEIRRNISVRQWNAIFNAGTISTETARRVGQEYLADNEDFRTYFGTRNQQQRADLRTFWHLPADPWPAAGEGAQAAPDNAGGGNPNRGNDAGAAARERFRDRANRGGGRPR